MEIQVFKKKTAKLCNSAKEMRTRFGANDAKHLQQRLAELRAAETLNDISRVPPAKCHELTQNRKGQLAVSVGQKWRLIFEPDHDPVPKKDDGGLDWGRVTAIWICEVVDYH